MPSPMDRLMGEWFRETPRLLTYIARVLSPPSAYALAARNEDAAAVRHIRETLRELAGKEPRIAGEIDPDRVTAILEAHRRTQPPRARTLSDLTPEELAYMNDHPVLGPRYA